jgi:hypothetical protein
MAAETAYNHADVLVFHRYILAIFSPEDIFAG